MKELVVFGYVAITTAVLILLWVSYHLIAECWEEWVYEYRRSQAFRDWRNKESHLRGME